MKHISDMTRLVTSIWIPQIKPDEKGPLVFAANLWTNQGIIGEYTSGAADLNEHAGFTKEELESRLVALMDGERPSLVIRYESGDLLHVVKYEIITAGQS